MILCFILELIYPNISTTASSSMMLESSLEMCFLLITQELDLTSLWKCIVYLERSGIEFMELNALLVHRFKNSWTLRGVKTDKTDARLIANYLSSIEFKPYPKISYHTLALRSLCKRHFDLINERTKYLIRITNFLDRTFPEFKEFIKGNIKSKTAMYIFHNYGIPSKIMNINIQSYENLKKNHMVIFLLLSSPN